MANFRTTLFAYFAVKFRLNFETGKLAARHLAVQDEVLDEMWCALAQLAVLIDKHILNKLWYCAQQRHRGAGIAMS